MRTNPVFVVLSLIGLGLAIYTIIDVTRRPDWVWQASGKSKSTWLTLGIVALFCFGIIIGLVYVLGIRPSLDEVQRRGMGGPGWPGGPGTGGWTPPPTSWGPPPPPPPPPPPGSS